MVKSLILILSLITFQISHSHEGHDHGAGHAHAPKGGVIHSLESIHLEFLSLGKIVNIYVYNKDMQPEDVKKFPVSATVTLPRKKPQPLALTTKSDHWEAEFDPQGAHRYTIELSIKHDKVKFTVEP